MPKFDFITIGGATEDIVFYTNEGLLVDNKKDLLRQELLAFEQGAKIRIEKSESFFGGGAANAAINFSQLGFRVAIVANLGADNRGKMILDNLKKRGVNISLLSFDKKINSGFSLILNNGKDRIVFTFRGSNDYLLAKHLNSKIDGEHIYLSSLPASGYQKLLLKIFSLNKKVYWNPGLAELSSGLDYLTPFLQKSDMLFVNKDEALELVLGTKKYTDKSNSYLNNIKNLIKIIFSYTNRPLMITSGTKGAHFFDGQELYFQKAFLNRDENKKGTVIDTTGVGDAFNSTFVALSLKFSGDYQKALKLASKNAASLVLTPGAQNGLLPLNKLRKN